MARNVPTPYAFAPTKSGKKLPWELGRPDQRDIPAEPTESDSAAQSSASPTPQRPVRGALFDRWRQGLLIDAQDQPTDPAEPIQPVQPAPPVPPPRRRRRGVCRCGECPDTMPTRIEKKCCQEEPLDRTIIEDYQEGMCLYTCEEIRHLFLRTSLRIAWLSQQQYLMLTGDALSFANMTTTNYRYHAYRSYTSYIHGLLGRWQRKVVPACLVKRIRELYPSADNTYVGYIHVNPETGEEIPHDELEQLQMELEGKNGNILVVLCCLKLYILVLHVPACNFW